METIATDVSLKIKSAIKAKLIELGLYTDEELPDYIMVMVANKRTRVQMVEDLQLFLGTSTEHFTNWLHQVLDKLQEVTVASIEKKKLAKQAQDDKPSKKSKDGNDEEHRVGRKRSSIEERKSDEGKSKHIKTEKGTAKDSDWIVCDKPRDVKITKVEDDVMKDYVESTKSSLNNGGASERTCQTVDSHPVRMSTETEKGSKVSGPGSRVHPPVTKPKIVLMQSDDDDDDEDFINIKADAAEAAELLDAELPEESPSHSYKPSTPEKSVSPPPVTVKRPSKELKTGTVNAVGVVDADKLGADGKQVVDVLKRTCQTFSDDGRKAGRRNASRSSAGALPITRSQGARMEGATQSLKRPSELPSDETNPKKRTMLSRVVALHRQGGKIIKEEVEEEYDPTNPAVGSVASVVRVKPRPKVPAALQASRNLILKAVAEAQKSVAAASVRRDPNERPSELRTKKYQMKIDEIQAKECEPNTQNDWKGIRDQENNNISNVPNRSVSSISSQENFRIRVTSGDSLDSPLSGKVLSRLTSTESDLEPESSSLDNPAGSMNTTESRPESPQFVVTLDGLERSLFEEEDDYELQKIEEQKPDNVEEKSKRHVSPIIFSPNSTSTVLTTSSKVAEAVPLKSIDRCRFWPACRLGDKCTFSHPTTPCKSFPNCKFGEKCLYIHPNCKFDAACTRRDCPFTHASPRLLAAMYSGISPLRQPVQMCKYFPNCSNANCPFIHPKACRYGRYCSKKGCTYQHHSNKIPAVHKLKWSSNVRT